jgi:NAD(P) transhydrogenase subunit alpha
LNVVVPAERRPGERRVALVPEVVARFREAGCRVLVERGAGTGAFFADEAYAEAGAELVEDRAALWRAAGVALVVQAPDPGELAQLSEGAAVVGLLGSDPALLEAVAARRASAFGLERLPRISRAQPMDALSSQASVAGYRAALLAAFRLARFMPMLVTAAGTVPPARVLVLGTGVAGLQAIATSRRLGAVVSAYDVRTAAREEVESLGGRFVELPLEAQEGAGGYARAQSEEFLARQRELLAEHVAAADAVVTTAAVPGRRAPVLLTASMVARMRPGSVVVDAAADSGGNCELTRPGEDVVHEGVTVVGASNLPSTMPTHASYLYARNLAAFVVPMLVDGALGPDFADEIVEATCLVRDGEVRGTAGGPAPAGAPGAAGGAGPPGAPGTGAAEQEGSPA